jgi:hypothetical protein
MGMSVMVVGAKEMIPSPAFAPIRHPGQHRHPSQDQQQWNQRFFHPAQSSENFRAGQGFPQEAVLGQATGYRST